MLYNLEGLRALAAFLVIFVHVEVLLSGLQIPKFGGGGVDVFFVISGLIMVHTTRDRHIGAVGFLQNRLVRIVPLYWFLTLGVFLIAALAPALLQSGTDDPVKLISSLFFLPYEKSDGVIQPLLFVGWTLNCEMYFYSLFAIGLATRNYFVGIGVTLAALVAVVVFGHLFQPGNVALRLYSNPIMLEFGAGMLIGLALPYLPKSAPGVVRPCLLALAAACVVALVLAPLHLTGLLQTLSTALSATTLVACAVMLESLRWRLTQPAVLWLGAASYSMYLSHPFVTQIFQKVGQAIDAQGAVAASLLAICVGCVILISLFVHKFVEKPLTLAVRHLVGAKRLKPPAELPTNVARKT